MVEGEGGRERGREGGREMGGEGRGGGKGWVCAGVFELCLGVYIVFVFCPSFPRVALLSVN